MNFKDPIKVGSFQKRYKRFFADIEFEDNIVTAHVANTGSLKGCLQPGSSCRMTHTKDPKRKLKYSLQMIKTKTSWVGVNTGLSNQLAFEAFEKKIFPHWQKFDGIKKEIKINEASRIDFLLWNSKNGLAADSKPSLKDFEKQKFHFVEVKNVTLAEGKLARFPDAVTTRGQKHIQEFIRLMDQGHTCELLFTVQRTDCTHFEPAGDIDPEYAKLLVEAKKKGMRISVIPCNISKNSIELINQPLKLNLN